MIKEELLSRITKNPQVMLGKPTIRGMRITLEHILFKMLDTDIIRLAVKENRMVITMDKDFGELVYHCGMDHCGVLLLRLEEATGAEKVQVVDDILAHYSTKINHCFCVFQHDKLRIKRAVH